jgi:hypothetical protein
MLDTLFTIRTDKLQLVSYFSYHHKKMRNLFITTTSIMDQINWDCAVNDQRSQHDALQAPPSFICPLTKAVMFDPVVLIDDKDSVSYERVAIASRYTTTQVVSNMALKELIHEFVGMEWVQQQQDQHMSFASNGTISDVLLVNLSSELAMNVNTGSRLNPFWSKSSWT